MKIFKKTLIAILCFSFIMVFFTGCPNKKDEEITQPKMLLSNTPTDVCFILGSGSNRPKIDSCIKSNSYIENVISVVAEFGGTISFIVNDGNPSVRDFAKITPIDGFYSKSQIKRKINNVVQQITDYACKLKAQAAETDMITSIYTAIKELQTGTSPQKLIIIVDSAIASTSGILNFSENNYIEASTDMTINYLKESHVFSDAYITLEGIDVKWFSFDNVSEPQAKITPTAKNNLENLWQVFFEAADSKSFNIYDTASDSKRYDGLPLVSTVAITSPESPEIIIEDTIKLSEETLLFKPDSIEFVDPVKATKTLEPILNTLLNNDQTILIAGMIATVNVRLDKGVAFSKLRADTVANYLIENGIDSERIVTVGLGYKENKYRVPDIAADGSLIEEEAAKNRAIIIMDIDSNDATKILEIA